MQARTFQEDLLIIPPGGCDLVLGNDWMKKHNPTKFDHEMNCVTIGRKRSKMVLKGICEEGKLSMINGSAMGKLLKMGNALFAHLFMMNNAADQDQEPKVILQVLDQFIDVFSEPKSLPPIRSLDHKINLKPGSSPVSLRPYRYKHFQKNELERQVKEMLNNEIIKPSQSPFSSPALLVKKGWNMEILCRLSRIE